MRIVLHHADANPDVAHVWSFTIEIDGGPIARSYGFPTKDGMLEVVKRIEFAGDAWDVIDET